MRWTRLLIGAAVLACAGLGDMPTADAASTSVSSNWAGYAVSGKKFRRVSGTWVVPRGACASGSESFSAAWVGLGGFASSSQSLEQIGTELDCRASGRAIYSAWYELVPSLSRDIRMAVRPGDTLSASVTARGARITLKLS